MQVHMGLHLVFQNVQRILFIHGGSKFKSTLVEKNRRQRGSRWLWSSNIVSAKMAC